MKFQLTVETNDASELSRVIMLITGKTAPATITTPSSVASVSDTATDDGEGEPSTEPHNPADVDSSGIRWDERIHAKTRAKTANGKWRYRRGVDDATVAAVEAELRANAAPVIVQPQPTTEPTPEQLFTTTMQQGNPGQTAWPLQPAPAPMPQTAPVVDPNAQEPIPAFLQRPMQPAPAVPAAPVAAAQPSPAPAQGLPVMNFQQLFAAISQGLRDKKIDNGYLGQLTAHYQLPNIPALATTHQHLIPNIVQELRNKGVL